MQKPDKNNNMYSWSNSRGFDSQAGGSRALLMVAVSMYVLLILVVMISLGVISAKVLSSHRPSSIKVAPPADSVQPAITEYADNSYGYTLTSIAGILSKSAVTIEIANNGSYSAANSVFGIAISPDGYIISGSEGLFSAKSIRVVDFYGNQYSARYVGHDSSTGLSVIKADGRGFTPPEVSPEIKVGERAAVYGSLSGSNFSVAESVFVSADSRLSYRSGSSALRGSFLQVAADTGTGCVVATDRIGRVVGISCYLPDSSVANRYLLNFNTATEIARSIINNGFVAGRFRPGLQCEPITEELADKIGANGVKVVYIEPESPLLSQGVSVGDILVSVNDQPLAGPDDLWSIAGRVGQARAAFRLYDASSQSFVTVNSYFIEDRG